MIKEINRKATALQAEVQRTKPKIDEFFVESRRLILAYSALSFPIDHGRYVPSRRSQSTVYWP